MNRFFLNTTSGILSQIEGIVQNGDATAQDINDAVTALKGAVSTDFDTLEEIEDSLVELSTRDFVTDFQTGLI